MRELLILCLMTSPAFAGVGEDRAKQLQSMVLNDCGSCHGATMKGGLGPPLTPDALRTREAETLSAIILDGRPGTAMPPWRPLLTQEEATWIANFLKQKEK
jgi:cytochrome c55X